MGELARGDVKEVGTRMSQKRILTVELLLPHLLLYGLIN